MSEEATISAALREAEGNVSKAAGILGIHRSVLYKQVRRLPPGRDAASIRNRRRRSGSVGIQASGSLLPARELTMPHRGETRETKGGEPGKGLCVIGRPNVGRKPCRGEERGTE
jgi:hypothetical protein